ncbi:Methyl-CpG-binding domain protein 2, partial [Ophiophagus hannah]
MRGEGNSFFPPPANVYCRHGYQATCDVLAMTKPRGKVPFQTKLFRLEAGLLYLVDKNMTSFVVRKVILSWMAAPAFQPSNRGTADGLACFAPLKSKQFGEDPCCLTAEFSSRCLSGFFFFFNCSLRDLGLLRTLQYVRSIASKITHDPMGHWHKGGRGKGEGRREGRGGEREGRIKERKGEGREREEKEGRGKGGQGRGEEGKGRGG